MKRDMELIRLLLLKYETGTDPEGLENFSSDAILYNLAVMADADLIKAAVSEYYEDGVPLSVDVDRLTWLGHDFLDATRSSKVWKAVKDHFLKPGVSFTFQVLLDYAKDEIKRQIGKP